MNATRNVDPDVAAGFGHEWSTFRQNEAEFSPTDRAAIFESYFDIFPWNELPPNPVGMDVGCGSGRWSVMVAPKVGHLHLLDASVDALAVARQNLDDAANVSFHLASVGDIPLQDNSLDFAFSLGVLHHMPDTTAAIGAIAAKLKTGAPFLVYLYYALDNRPWWYRTIWRISNIFRLLISRLPPKPRLIVSQQRASPRSARSSDGIQLVQTATVDLATMSRLISFSVRLSTAVTGQGYLQ
jgi:SAM-dependent methyltransferase